MIANLKSTLAVLCSVTAIATAAPAAAEYPEKPITMIVAYSPGGGTDTAARTIAKYVEKHLGQRLVVENKAGAGGQIGFSALATAKPDGYEIGFVNVPSIHLVKKLREGVPYEISDFDPIANIQRAPSGKSGHFGGGDRLHGSATAEKHRTALIDDEEHGALAFLRINTDLGFPESGGGLPVDRPDIIALRIVAQFLESETASPQARGMSPRQQGMHRLAWQETESAGIRFEPDQVIEGDGDSGTHSSVPPRSSFSSSIPHLPRRRDEHEDGDD